VKIIVLDELGTCSSSLIYGGVFYSVVSFFLGISGLSPEDESS
jgi:hypothetical protein